MDDDCVGVRNIKPCLYNRCRHKHIYVTIYKVKHYLLELSFVHLSMCVGNIGIRNYRRYLRRHILNALHHIEHIVHLPAPRKLSYYCLPYKLLVILRDKGLYRHPVDRCLCEHTHVPYTHKAHVQGSRNRRCRQCEHVKVRF